jgi:hypothetical protein
MNTKTKHAILILLALLLVISLRLPITSHELGQDSYSMHFMAQSILDEGHAKWVIHPMSVIGVYNYSYPSGAVYLLSITSSLIGINIEWTIFILSIIFGIIGFFGAYLLASEIKNTFFFKFITALLFATLPLSIKFTSWTYSTRGLFIMLVPFFIWSLIKSYKEKKFISLTILLFILMATIHRMAIILLLITFAFGISLILNKYFNKEYLKKKFGLIIIPFIIFIPLIFLYSGRPSWIYRSIPTYLKFNNNLISNIGALSYELFARLGFIFILSLLGIFCIYFIIKSTDYKLYFLTITTAIISVFIYKSMYFYQTIAIVFVILSVITIDTLRKKVPHSKYVVGVIILILITFSIFTINVRVENNNFMHNSLDGIGGYINTNIPINEKIQGVDQNKIKTIIQNRIGSTSLTLQYIYDNLDIQSERELKGFPTTLGEISSFLKKPFLDSTFPSLENNEEINYNIKSSSSKVSSCSNNLYENSDYELIELTD